MKARPLPIVLALLAAACAAVALWTRVDVVRDGRPAAVDVLAPSRSADAPRPADQARTSSLVGAEAAGERPLERELVARSERTPSTAMRPGVIRGVLSLTVVDAGSGAPIAGAKVTRKRRDLALGTSDEHGVMELQPSATAQEAPRHEWTVSAPGYCPVHWSWERGAQESGDLGVLPLLPCAWFEGRVSDDAGHPLDDVVVHAFHTGQNGGREDEYATAVAARWKDELPSGRLRFRGESLGVETDRSGVYRLPVTPTATPFVVSAARQGYIQDRAEGLVLDTARGQRVDFVLPRGASVFGTVLRNGVEWTGELRLTDPDKKHKALARVEQGRYELTGLEPGPIHLSIVEPLTKTLVCEATLVVAPGQHYRQDLAWNAAVQTIAGRVVDSGGRGLGGIAVAAWRSASERRELATKSDAGGTFELEVPAGLTFTVLATDRVLRTEAHAVPAGARDVVLVLGGSGMLDVELLDAATGEPIVADNMIFLTWARSRDGDFRRLKTRLSAQGKARVRIPTGPLVLAVDLGSMGYVREVADVAITERGGALSFALERGVEIELVLDPQRLPELRRHGLFLLEMDRQNQVRERLPGDDEARVLQVGDTLLSVDPAFRRQRHLTFDGHGRARVNALGPGSYVLRCFPGDLVVEPATIQVGSADATIALALVRR